MGGSKKKQTVGYKYYAGVSMVLCQGTIDKLTNISVADRTAWRGAVQDGQIAINKQGLFGGDKREGGVSGTVDVYSGHHQHNRNSYLASKLSAIVPAYRHVAGLVFRQFYWGNNPYMKDISAVVQRIHYQDSKKTRQWYDSKAEIKTENGSANTAIHFILDTSMSMSGGRIQALKSAMKRAIQNLSTSIDLMTLRLDILITTYQGGSPQTKLVRKVSQNDIVGLLSFIDNLKIVGGENLENVLSHSINFFKDTFNQTMNRCCIFVSDGELENADHIKNEEIHNMIDKKGQFNEQDEHDVKIFCINVDNTNKSLSSKIDNTPEDGIPVIKGTDSNIIYDTIMNAINNLNADMNPAHILRELVVNQQNGFNSSLIKNSINEDSFRQAADLFYREKLGLSYIWNDQSKFEDLKKNIENTANCVLYQNAKTNQFEIKVIRNDYHIEKLPLFDKTNIVKISDIKKNIITEMINSVTVNFIDRTNDYKQGSVTVRDDALILMAGRENNTTVTYDMVYNRSLASRLALRDLAALSSDLASVSLTLNLDGRMLNRGDVFVLDMPQLGLNKAVMRVTSLDYGTQKSNQVTVECMRDVFSLPSSTVVSNQPVIIPTTDINLAKPAEHYAIMECPYYELVYNYGQREVDFMIQDDKSIGQIAATIASPPEGTFHSELVTSLSNTFENPENIIDCEMRLIEHELDQVTSIITLNFNPPEQDYNWILIGNEILYVQSFSNNQLTVKRGCLDTLPEKHEKGSKVYFCGGQLSLKSDEYYQGDKVDCRIITNTSTDSLDPSLATGAMINIQGRAAKPYPPANVTINNFYFPDKLSTDQLYIKWSSRNRLQQTSGELIGWYESDITPESGVKYHVTIKLNKRIIVDQIIDVTTFELDVSEYLQGTLDIQISSIVDNIYCFTPFSHSIELYNDLIFKIHEEQSAIDKNNLLVKIK